MSYSALFFPDGRYRPVTERTCLRCEHVLVGEDEVGPYYQVPATEQLPAAPDLGIPTTFTFMDRVHTCTPGGPAHVLDPEMLPAQEKIRYAERMIRRDHGVLDEDHLFWGNLASILNWAATIPDRTAHRPSDWQVFGYAQDLAAGYFRQVSGTEKS